MPTRRTLAAEGAATTSAAAATATAMPLRIPATYNGSAVLSRQSRDELARPLCSARDPQLRRRRRGTDPRRGPPARAEPLGDEPPSLRAARRGAADPGAARRVLAAGQLLRPGRDG